MKKIGIFLSYYIFIFKFKSNFLTKIISIIYTMKANLNYLINLLSFITSKINHEL
jgi:hypothetical protein